METNFKHQFRVGVFLAIGLAAILVTILLLGGDKAFFKKKVTLFALATQAQGLNKGSVVSLAGITIGNVDNITFSKEKKSLIISMKIQEEYLDRLSKDSTADIRTQGALGDKFVYINPGESFEATLKDQDFVDTVKSTDILGMLSEKGNEAAKVFDIINEVHKLVKIINSDGRSEKIVSNLTEASQSLKGTALEAKNLIAEMRGQNPQTLKESLDHLNSVMTKLDKGEGTLGALINDPTIHEKIKTLLGADSRKNSIQSLIRTTIEKSER